MNRVVAKALLLLAAGGLQACCFRTGGAGVDEGAAATHFGRLAASGWHTCSMTMAMMVEHAAVEPRSSLGALGIDELRWLKPVYPGDVLSCEMALLDKRRSRSKPGLGILNLQMTTFNQHGEAVLAMKPITLVRARES